MSVATVVGKAGGAGLLMVGVPGACYLAKDHIFYYEIERKIMSGDIKVSVTVPSEQANNVEVASVSSESNPSWKCVIKAKDTKDKENIKDLTELDDKKKLANYIKNNILTTDNANTVDEKKKNNLRTLVLGCANKRTKEEKTAIESEWVVFVQKETDHLLVSFFGTEDKANTTS